MVGPARGDVPPAPVSLSQGDTEGVWQEHEGEQETSGIEGGRGPELVPVDKHGLVVEPDGGPEGAHLGHPSRDTVGSGTHLSWVQLTCTTPSTGSAHRLQIDTALPMHTGKHIGSMQQSPPHTGHT